MNAATLRLVPSLSALTALVDRHIRAHRWEVQCEDQDDEARAGYCLLRSMYWTADGQPDLARALRFALAHGEQGAAVVLGSMLVEAEAETICARERPRMVSGKIGS